MCYCHFYSVALIVIIPGPPAMKLPALALSVKYCQNHGPRFQGRS